MSGVISSNAVQVKAKSYVVWPVKGATPRAGYHSWAIPSLVKAYGGTSSSAPGGGKVGIVCLGGGYSKTDIGRLATTRGFPAPNIYDVSVDGVAGNSYGNDPADGEAALDIACVAGAYSTLTGKPAEIYMLFCQNTLSAFTQCVNKAVELGLDVVSCSWGLAESMFDQTEAANFCQTMQKANNVGLTFFVASGDNSANDNTGAMTVDMPSACPYVTSVGGTLKLDTEEQAWGTGNPLDQGGGGGFSQLFAVPPWQKDCPQPRNSTGRRMVPDVSAVADPNTGYEICLYNQFQAIGGTSGSAPFWAGIVAAAGVKFGNINPFLYSTPGVTVDITKGSNGWPAQVGPDPVTGLGVPNIDKLVAALIATKSPTSPPPVVVSPPPPPGAPTQVLYTKTDNADGSFLFAPSASKGAAAPALSIDILGWYNKAKDLVDQAYVIMGQYGSYATDIVNAVHAFVDNPSLATLQKVQDALNAFATPTASANLITKRSISKTSCGTRSALDTITLILTLAQQLLQVWQVLHPTKPSCSK